MPDVNRVLNGELHDVVLFEVKTIFVVVLAVVTFVPTICDVVPLVDDLDKLF